MVAGGQRARRVVEPRGALVGLAGVELGAERLDLDPQTVLAARVIAQHVQQCAAAPELLAVLEFVDDGRTVPRVIGSQDHEHAHAQADQAPRHPVQHDHRNRYHPPQPFDRESHHGRGLAIRMPGAARFAKCLIRKARPCSIGRRAGGRCKGRQHSGATGRLGTRAVR